MKDDPIAVLVLSADQKSCTELREKLGERKICFEANSVREALSHVRKLAEHNNGFGLIIVEGQALAQQYASELKAIWHFERYRTPKDRARKNRKVPTPFIVLHDDAASRVEIPEAASVSWCSAKPSAEELTKVIGQALVGRKPALTDESPTKDKPTKRRGWANRIDDAIQNLGRYDRHDPERR